MIRNLLRFFLLVVVIMLWIAPSVHAAANRIGGADLSSTINVRPGIDTKINGSPNADLNTNQTINSNLIINRAPNRIGELSLSSTSVTVGSTVQVTVTGTGSCLARVENAGVQIIHGKSFVDLAGGFPKTVSLVVQGAPGSYTIKASNANPLDLTCSGIASATLVVTDASPKKIATLATPVALSKLGVASVGPSSTVAPVPSPFANKVRPVPKTVDPTVDTPEVAEPTTEPEPVYEYNNVPSRPMPVTTAANGAADLLRPIVAKPRVVAKPPIETHEPGQVVILWDETSEGLQGLNILARDFKVQSIQRTELKNLGGMMATFQVRDTKLAIVLRDILRQQYPTWHVDLHARYQSFEGPRIYLPSKIDMPDKLTPLPKLKIGILDTAVTPIPALKTAKLTQRSFLADVDTPASTEHGTAVAALISGHDKANHFQGLAVGAQIFVGAIMREQAGKNGTNTVMLINALDWLIGSKVHVINLSLGGPGDALMESIFAKLQKKGVIIVASAGNGGPNASPSFPAAYRGVLAVTAVDALDQSYSEANSGQYVAIAAPGVDVWTPDAAQGHYVSGTSFSAAVVTGAIGLMLSQKAELTAEKVREKLCHNARDLGTSGVDPVYGCGLMQIKRALTVLK